MRKMNFARVLATCVLCGLMAANMMAERVTPDDAALVANTFMNPVSGTNAKKAPAKRMVLKSAAAAEEQYYIYENADGEGWVMISANDVVTPILAYSETGHFRTDNLPSNVSKWLGHYNKFIRQIEADGAEAGEETAAEWTALRKGQKRAKTATPVVGPLVKTTWDQDAPYWNLCPGSGSSKAYTGCVATAMAQVMNYWQWPKKGTGSRTYQPMDPNSDTGASSKRYGKLTANFGNTTYDWTNMLDSYSGSYSNAQATAVATLMYHCGVATDMMYGNDADGGSGTYTVNYDEWDWPDSDGECAQNAFHLFFGYKKSSLTGYMRDGYSYGGTTYYTKWTDAAWTNMIKEELDKNHPILYGGSGDGGGHSFICDGYNDANYFHFNWGWSGSNDGYYRLSNLAPGSGGAGGGDYSFSQDQDVIIGIVPDKKDLPMITITWWANGETTTSSIMQEDPLELPTTPANCSENQVFVGWTENSSVNGEKPEDLFKTAAGKTVLEPVTYYAVYATKGEGSGPENDSKTFTLATIADALSWENGVAYTSIEDSPVMIKAEGGGNNGKWYVSNNSWRLYNGGTVRISVEGGIVTSVTSTPACDFTISNGEATYSPSARTDFTSFTVNYTAEGGASYSDYTISCGEVVPCDLTSISLNTNDVKKAFTVGSEFTYSGLIVNAKYSNCKDRKVSPTSVSTPDMSTPGTKIVTVSYTEHGKTQTAQYDVIVTEQTTFSIRFFNNGKVISTQQVVEGKEPNVPANPSVCEDYTFVGWFGKTLAPDNTSKMSWVSDFTAVQDQDYYAVYQHTETSGSASTTTITDKLTNSTTGSSGSTYALWSGKTVSSEAVYAGNSAGSYSSIQLRSKNNNSGIVTTSSGGKLTKVKVEWNSNTAADRTLDIYGNNAAYEDPSELYGTIKGTKIGSIKNGTTEVTINGNYTYVGVRSNNSALYLDELSFIWETTSGGTSTTYYTSECACTATEIENLKVISESKKVLIDGQLYIIVGEQMYSVTGSRVK